MPGPAIALAGASLAGGLASASAAKKGAKAQADAAKDSTALQKYIFDQTTENFAPFLGAGKDAMSAYLYEMGLGPKPTFGATAPTIETIQGQTTTTQGRGPNGEIHPAYSRTSRTPETYRVGGQTFSTLGEAQEWANANKTGGTEYQGYSMTPMARYLMEQGQEGIQGAAASAGGLFSGASLQALEDDRRRVVQADTSDYFSKLFGLTSMGMSAAGNQANAGQGYANNVSQLNMQAGQAKAAGYAGAANAFGNTLGDMAGIYGYFNNPMAAYSSPTMIAKMEPWR